jgi:hypothetical protein
MDKEKIDEKNSFDSHQLSVPKIHHRHLEHLIPQTSASICHSGILNLLANVR